MRRDKIGANGQTEALMPELTRMPEANVYQAYGVYLLHRQHRLIRRLMRVYEPSVHGHKLWRASFLLMDYLQSHPPKKGSKILEIGCGWGSASVFCARRFGADVTGVDVDGEIFPFLDVIAALNSVKVQPYRTRYEKLTTRYLGAQDLIIGSDVCFWDNLIKPLRNLIARALRGGVSRIVIADPGRPTFYELVDLCAKRWDITLKEWYAVEPNRTTGEVLEIRG
ncbi:MAG: class I SAM-dependent methyltransferase [Pseudomonadales bacterium]